MKTKLVVQLLGSHSERGMGSSSAWSALGAAGLHSELEKMDESSDQLLSIHPQAKSFFLKQVRTVRLKLKYLYDFQRKHPCLEVSFSVFFLFLDATFQTCVS